METTVQNVIQPDFSFGVYQIQPDNAFITPAIAAVTNPLFAAGDAPYYSAFINDNRTQGINRQTYRVVGQVGGDFDLKITDVKFDTALNYGQTYSRFNSDGIQVTNNFAAAIDSVIDPTTGQAACRINVPSAQPVGYVAPAVANGRGLFTVQSLRFPGERRLERLRLRPPDHARPPEPGGGQPEPECRLQPLLQSSGRSDLGGDRGRVPDGAHLRDQRRKA